MSRSPAPRTAWPLVGVLLLAPACAHRRTVNIEPMEIIGDAELAELNDEELFAKGSSAFAAEDFTQAARYFGRLADAFPDSKHRRPAIYNAGLAHERLKDWSFAKNRFLQLADPAKGQGDALDAAFRLAETHYHMNQYDEAVAVLRTIAERTDIPLGKRFEAKVQHGICQLEAGKSQEAEATLRGVVETYNALTDKEDVDDYFPCQAQFFLGEVYRLHFEGVKLEVQKGVDQLAKDLEYKAQLLLSAQGHYLRAIRMGNGYWATAAGARIGGLYENLYGHMVDSPTPSELDTGQVSIYRHELRRRIRVLVTKAISIYERTLETAERIGSESPFVEQTRKSLQKMKDLLLADSNQEDDGTESAPSPPKSDVLLPVPAEVARPRARSCPRAMRAGHIRFAAHALMPGAGEAAGFSPQC